MKTWTLIKLSWFCWSLCLTAGWLLHITEFDLSAALESIATEEQEEWSW